MPNNNPLSAKERSQEIKQKIQEIMEKLRTPGNFNSPEEVDKFFEDSLWDIALLALDKAIETRKTF
jgi:hypothetical protein